MSDLTTAAVAALKRVGHKGADLIVPGNTPASFDAALRAGVDMIEFDVLPADPHEPRTSPLLLAHDYAHVGADTPTLDDGLAHLAGSAFTGIGLDVDLKWHGYEDRVVEALQRHGLVDRSLVSSTFPHSLDRVRALEPVLRLGWSVPRAKRDYTQSKATLPVALAALAAWRRRFPPRARQAIASGRFDAIMAHWRLITPRLVEAVHDAGGELYAWTVDERPRILALEAMGVTGVITNDPRLFAAA